uniref:Putative rep protein n=1 Tax=uncultured virus TaxID=340016 RepID=A0A1D8MJV7_9VIRU|nr:putative rep protein [uncultured virus]
MDGLGGHQCGGHCLLCDQAGTSVADGALAWTRVFGSEANQEIEPSQGIPAFWMSHRDDEGNNPSIGRLCQEVGNYRRGTRWWLDGGVWRRTRIEPRQENGSRDDSRSSQIGQVGSRDNRSSCGSFALSQGDPIVSSIVGREERTQDGGDYITSMAETPLCSLSEPGQGSENLLDLERVLGSGQDNNHELHRRQEIVDDPALECEAERCAVRIQQRENPVVQPPESRNDYNGCPQCAGDAFGWWIGFQRQVRLAQQVGAVSYCGHGQYATTIRISSTPPGGMEDRCIGRADGSFWFWPPPNDMGRNS